jgi:hypothetical protein
MTVAVRTNAAILADLLSHAVDTEWSGRSNVACHCHPEYEAACPSCDALKYENGREDEQHMPECALAALIEEARAFLRIVNEMIGQRNDPDEEYLRIA